MSVSWIEGKYVTDHSKDFVERAIQKGLGRAPSKEELEERKNAGGNMELDPDQEFIIERYYAPVFLADYTAYVHRVLAEFEVVPVSAQFKQSHIEMGVGFEPTEEEILMKYPDGLVPKGYELIAVERDLVPTLGDWQEKMELSSE